MKKIQIRILVVLFAFFLLYNLFQNNRCATFAASLGDVDDNQQVDSGDALLVLKYAAKLETLSVDAIQAAEVTGDEIVDANDALDILKYAAKMIRCFTVEIPSATDNPEITEPSEITEIPKETEIPQETEIPKETEVPQETENPKETETPQETEDPSATDVPVMTEEPEESHSPELELVPVDSPKLLIHPAIMDFVEGEPGINISTVLSDIRKKQGRLDYDIPVQIAFSVNYVTKPLSVRYSKVILSENQDLSQPRIFVLKSSQTEVAAGLLKSGRTYYYQVQVALSDGNMLIKDGSFATAPAPRIIMIDGICNVRDIGGWKTTDGKTIRQGLVYRGSELDGAMEPFYCLTDAGAGKMLRVLGIKTDMDMRDAKENIYQNHALGESVEHIYYGLSPYKYIFWDKFKSIIKEIFRKLSDASAYPMYIHCTYGQDRTGTICYLLEALLGMSEEDLFREYELSYLYNGHSDRIMLAEMIQKLQTTYEGQTIQEKVENYLISCGILKEEIDQIKNILLEE